MRNSIATYKESLSRIANDVLDAAEELDIPRSLARSGSDEMTISARRFSHRSPRPTPPVGSPVSNGSDSGSLEIARYKADIQKLQASEAEIKALSFNYASILKDKEEQLSKLFEENDSLRKSLETKSAYEHEHEQRDGSQRELSNSSSARKGTADQSPNKPPRHVSQVNSGFSRNHLRKGIVSRQDGFSNGNAHFIQFDSMQQNTKPESTNSHGNEEEHANMLEENHKDLAVQASHESEIEELKAQLESEHENATIIKLKLQEERRLNECSQRELHDLKMDKERISAEMKELHKDLNEKISELRRLQVELTKRDMEERNHSLDSMEDMIRSLEKENAKLKIERDELAASSKFCTSLKSDGGDLDDRNGKTSKSNEVTEEMTQSMRKLEDTLKDTCKERDKALQEVARLKQHLLDKELEDTDKMDEDSKLIEELTSTSEYQRAHILQLEKALRQEKSTREEISKLKNDESQRSNELAERLKQKLADCMKTVDLKNVELLNLQTALGQYYAEIEAKERLGRELAMAKEEAAKISESLKLSSQGMENLKRENEDIAAKLIQAERMLSESKLSIQKLGEDNSKLRHVLEQSMTRLNRMSVDSDNYVDRRIVIKLLVTYFQRNHSKEVLDLMVRMLGFSEEDKQRIGLAQHAAAGKGVVRGVLGLPGRLVGGILGGSSPEASSSLPSENQSFADLWVDFLVKATEERESRESSEASKMMPSNAVDARARVTDDERRTNFAVANTVDSFPNVSSSAKRNQSIEHSDSEFATVPLTSSSVSPPKRTTSTLYWR